jgi:IPT/TIG domain
MALRIFWCLLLLTIALWSPRAYSETATETTISSPASEHSEQPEITRIEPLGGKVGDTVTIYGKNFGDDRKKIKIQFTDPETNKQKEIKPIEPVFLAKVPDKQEYQLRFMTEERRLLDNIWLKRSVPINIIVNDQPSNYMTFTLVTVNWEYKIAFLTMLLLIVLLVFQAFAIKKINFLKSVVLDPKTNTYSLSRCQAFVWTLVLIGSYFYLAVGKSLIFGKGEIPDFNASLLVLMGISYGGSLAAEQLNRVFPKKELTPPPPRLINLISEGGEVSLPRLQLVGFTVTAIVIYLYNLSGADFLSKGLPDIPPTLLGLLGISQGGYLGGKVVGGRMSVNYILPRRLLINKDVELSIIGSGFDDKTKILVQDYPELLDPERHNENYLTLKTLKFAQAGSKDIVLVPPTGGGSLVLRDVLEVVDARIEKIERLQNVKQVKVRLKGFYPDEIQGTVAGRPATVIPDNKEKNQIILEAKEDLRTGDPISIESSDGELKADILAP